MTDFRFEIAFSYAGEQLDQVSKIATLVRNRIGHPHVYLFKWFYPEMRGPRMEAEVARIYREQSRMIVVCLSAQYAVKDWTLYERDCVRGLLAQIGVADTVNRLRLYMIRFDDTPMLGFSDDFGYVDARKSSAEAIAEELLQRHTLLCTRMQPKKIRSNPDPLPPPPPPPPPPPSPVDFHNSIGMRLIQLPASSFEMGDPDGSEGEAPHRVTITHPYFLGNTPVTQRQWKSTMPEHPNPSKVQGDDLPVENVSWHDCMEFCERLSQMEKRKYRLPTEAEWENACRVGPATRYVWGNDLSQGRGWANMFDQTAKQALPYLPWDPVPWSDSFAATSPVRTFKPNERQLYDMIGNVWEWCSDWYAPFTASALTNPVGPSNGTEKVLRGSSWYDPPSRCRIACRNRLAPTERDGHIGFRVAVTRS